MEENRSNDKSKTDYEIARVDTAIEEMTEPETKSGRTQLKSWQIIALSPFIYILLGVFLNWWAWGWLIIPVSAIFFTPMPSNVKIVALSPFLYILLGMIMGWWAFGWIIIPISGILFAANPYRSPKRTR
ncbi:MAG: hypothetical protein FWE82_04820 [Defluviitaleaceae bacterium]|nr:hypothetical protein [Defluviitaleaceae bacterium]